MSKHTTIRLSNELADLVDSIRKATSDTDEVPAINQSETIRLLLRSSARRLARGESIDPDVEGISDEDLKELVPDHTIARYLREDLKDESWLIDMREGFEGRVREQLAKRFRGGYDPEGIEEFARTFTQEAHIYWMVLENDEETYQEKVSFVNEKVEEYQEKWESSTYDPDDEWLDNFDGVEDGARESTIEDRDDLIQEARLRIDNARSPDPEAIATSISKEHNVSEQLASRAVDRAVVGNGGDPHE